MLSPCLKSGRLDAVEGGAHVDEDVRAAQGAFDPVLTPALLFQRSTTPVTSSIGGAARGSLFAVPVLRSGNLWGAMGWHAGWNWWLATAFELPVTGIDAHLPALVVALRPLGPDALTGGAEGPEGSVLCSAVFAMALAGMGLAAVRRRRKP